MHRTRSPVLHLKSIEENSIGYRLASLKSNAGKQDVQTSGFAANVTLKDVTDLALTLLVGLTQGLMSSVAAYICATRKHVRLLCFYPRLVQQDAMRVPHIDTQRWPVRLCEPSPGSYAVRISFKALVEAATRDLAGSHVDMAAIQQAGYIDVKTFPQHWKFVSAIVIYWGALGLSQYKWEPNHGAERWLSLEAISGVLAESKQAMGRIEEDATSIMSLPDNESQAKLKDVPLAHGDIWAFALTPLLSKMADTLLRYVRYMIEFESTAPPWYALVRHQINPVDAWNLKKLPTPVSPLNATIVDADQPFVEEPIVPDPLLSSWYREYCGGRQSLDIGTAGSPNIS